jgi:ELWxxDGT repeat protein
MKKITLLAVAVFISAITASAQVTQINSNNSLRVVTLLSNIKAIAVSEIDSSIWVTDGTLAGTVLIAPGTKFEAGGVLLGGKLVFSGNIAGTGSELFTTDGTTIGTVLVKDIYAGTTGSIPGDFALMNGFVYFSAATAAEGRELWKSDGSPAGTTLVKDIIPGPDSSNKINQYHLFSAGSYLLFAAKTAASGIELWKSDGSNTGTNLLLDINTGNGGADSSNPEAFFPFNGIVLFTATNATQGNEIWKTDGTPGGTTLLRDINPGAGSSTSIELFPGFAFPVFLSFHVFNNRAYFNAFDGTSNGQVWVTDGTTLNTTLLKDIITGASITSFVLIIDAVNLPGKFIFPVSDGVGRSELWESDGTPGGTVLFKSFTPVDPEDIPFIAVPYSYEFISNTLTQPLFQGNKFFFSAGTGTEGYELWISDGTLPGTALVKDIFPGVNPGIDFDKSVSYLYTTTQLFFAAGNGTQGNELWKTNGTDAGTSLVFDINPNAADALPDLNVICNAKIIFGATDGDHPTFTDLYAVDGNFIPLPVKLSNFVVSIQTKDALLQWTTLQEINTQHFTIQRSYDAAHYDNIGTVMAAGTGSTRRVYNFTDKDVINSGKPIVYYRLIAVDKDGKYEYSKVVSLKLKSPSWEVRLLANPVKSTIGIMLSAVTGNVQVAINDLAGKRVYYNTFNYTNAPIHIPAQQLPEGFYVMTVTNKHEQKVLRFVK